MDLSVWFWPPPESCHNRYQFVHLCAGALWDNVFVSVLSVFVGVQLCVGLGACVFEYVCVCLALLCVCVDVHMCVIVHMCMCRRERV